MSCNPAYTIWKPVNTFSFTAMYMKGGGEGCNYQALFPILSEILGCCSNQTQ